MAYLNDDNVRYDIKDYLNQIEKNKFRAKK